MKKRIVSTLLALTLCLTLLPMAAFAEESGGSGQQYYDGSNVVTLPADTTVTTVNGGTTTWTDGWYFLENNVTDYIVDYIHSTKIDSKVTVDGDVNLIMEQDSILELPNGLEIKEGATLTIYRNRANSYSEGILCGSWDARNSEATSMTISGKGTVQAIGGNMKYTQIGMGMTYKDAQGETYAVTAGNLELDSSGAVSMETGMVQVSANGTVQTGNYKYQGDGSSTFLLVNNGLGVIIQIDKKDGRVKVNNNAYWATLLATLKAGKDEAGFVGRTVTGNTGSGFILQGGTGSSVTLLNNQISAMVNSTGVVGIVSGANPLTVAQGESAYTVKVEKAEKIYYSANFLNAEDGTKNEDWTVTYYPTVVDGTEFSLDSTGTMTLTRGGYVQAVLSAGQSCTGAASGKEIKNSSTSGSEKVTVETYADGYDIARLDSGNGDGQMTISDKQFTSQELSRVAWAVYPDGTMKMVTGYVELAAGESVTLFDSGNVYKNIGSDSEGVRVYHLTNASVTAEYESVTVYAGQSVSINGRTYAAGTGKIELRYYSAEQAKAAGVPAGLAVTDGTVKLAKGESITVMGKVTDSTVTEIVAAVPVTNTGEKAITVFAGGDGSGVITLQPGGEATINGATVKNNSSRAIQLGFWNSNVVGSVNLFGDDALKVNGVTYSPAAEDKWPAIAIDGDGTVILPDAAATTTDLTGGYTLSGKVIEAGSDSVVYGALVKLQDGSGKPVKVPGAVTDENGEYEIRNVPAGLYNVIITYGQSNEYFDEMSTVEYLRIFADYPGQTHYLYNRINAAFEVKDGLPFQVIESGALTMMAQFNMTQAPNPNSASDYTLTVESSDETVLPKGTNAAGKTTLNFKTTLTSGLTGDAHYTNAEAFATSICLPMDDVDPKNLQVFAKATRYNGEEIEAFELTEFSQSSNSDNKIFDWDEDCKILQITCDGYKQVGYTVMYDKPASTTSGSGGSSGGSSSSSTSTTTKNEDGSTTTTTTDKNGNVTETTKDINGVTGTTKTDKDGKVTDVSANIPASATQGGETVTLPVDEVKPADKSENATEIKIDVPSGGATVVIPVEDPTPGTVIVIVDKNGNETIVPGSKVTENGIKITLTEDATVKVIDNSKQFGDVPAGSYFEDAVKWASSRNITGGLTESTFAPHASCTRAQIVTFLWRAAGSPEPKTTSGFTDVSADAYYAKAVAWAVENGITNGFADGTFGVDMPCTRAQAVAFLFRYAAANGMDFVTLQELVSGYGDADSVPGYALPAFNWALAGGIVTGNNGDLMPNNACTRAQIVTFLYRLLGK